MTDRPPYLELSAADKDAVHRWLADHRVDYTAVPVWAQFEFDASTGEWLIPVYARDANGRMMLDGRGDVRKAILRRRELRPLPWPELDGACRGPA